MGQKENPIALRLSINRTIDSSWYSDTNYASFHSYDCSIRKYLQNIYKSGKILPSRIVSHILPKRHSINLTTYNSNKKKGRRGEVIGIKESSPTSYVSMKSSLINSDSKKNVIQPFFLEEGKKNVIQEKRIEEEKIHYIKNNSFVELEKKNDISLSSDSFVNIGDIKRNKKVDLKNSFHGFSSENILCRSLLLHAFESEKRKISLKMWNGEIQVYKQLLPSLHQSILNFENKNTQGISEGVSLSASASQIQGFHQNHIEKTLSKNSGITTNFSVFKTKSSFQSAIILASLIKQGFEKRQSFRKLWDTILKDLPNTPKKSFFVKGIRIVCSGRLGGVEMAKSDIRKWGETPLHSFNQKIDYAEIASLTRFGKIGVKVWICYR